MSTSTISSTSPAAGTSPKADSTSRTPWFPPDVQPEHRGVYERNLETIGVRYAYWNGRYWGGFATILEHALNNRFSETGHPIAPWRGLAVKPKGCTLR